MLNVLKFNTKSVYAIGDLHGEFNVLPYFIKSYDIKDSIIIVCGDIGIGFNKKDYYKQVFTKIGRELKKRNVIILLVRGNHDNKECFDSVEYNTKYIKLISDYSIIQVYDINDIKQIEKSFNILCVGGAVSIDRRVRINENKKQALIYSRYHGCTYDEAIIKSPKSYWENEVPLYDINKLDEIKDSGITIDAVITHTCPDFCQPYTKEGIKYWLDNDEYLENDVDYERQIMTNIYNKLIEDCHPLKEWSYGHFHFHKTEFINNVRFCLLDMVRNNIVDFICIKDFDKN